MQWRLEGLSPRGLGRVYTREDFAGRFISGQRMLGVRRRSKDQRCVVCGQVPREDARRGEVLDRIQTARELGVIAEVAIPVRLMAVLTVRGDVNRGDALVGAPDQPISMTFGLEAEGAVLK